MPFYSTPGGGVAFNEEGLAPLPPGWAVITEAAYNSQLAIINAADAATAAGIALAACNVRKAIYDDLVDGAGPFTKQFAAIGTTDGSGNVTFNLTAAGFTGNPVVLATFQTADTAATEIRITALSATSVTLNARRAPAVTVLGISVVSAPVPFSGATIHMVAHQSGTSAGGLGLTDATAHGLSGWDHGDC